jgi:hypothetical protein
VRVEPSPQAFGHGAAAGAGLEVVSGHGPAARANIHQPVTFPDGVDASGTLGNLIVGPVPEAVERPRLQLSHNAPPQTKASLGSPTEPGGSRWENDTRRSWLDTYQQASSRTLPATGSACGAYLIRQPWGRGGMHKGSESIGTLLDNGGKGCYPFS